MLAPGWLCTKLMPFVAQEVDVDLATTDQMGFSSRRDRGVERSGWSAGLSKVA